MRELFGHKSLWLTLSTCYLTTLFLPPRTQADAEPEASLTLVASVEDETHIDAALAFEDQQTKAALLDVLGKTKLDANEHPEIARALGHYGNLPTEEQIARRLEILNSIPTMMPVNKSESYISSGYGERDYSFSKDKQFHKGLDLAGPDGVAIYAPADGIVRYAAKYGRFGNYISIVHGYGIVTKYAHVEQILVKGGQYVKRGQKIATMGKTGRVTGTHLHYEVWMNDHAVNPRRFFIDTPETQQKPSITVANVE